MIQKGTADREIALRDVFLKWRPAALKFLHRNGGNTQDFEDAIQDAVIILDNHIRSGQFNGQSSLKSYFLGICKGALYSKRRSQKRVDLSDQQMDFDKEDTLQPEVLMLEQEQKNMLEDLLHMLEDGCRKVLQLYRLSFSMQEIADELQLGSANNVRQRVFKCRRKLITLVDENPLFANYFKGLA